MEAERVTRIGLALGGERTVAWFGGQPRLLSPDLPTAMEELRALAGARPATLHVALLPPMVEIKRIEFPPLRRAEVEAVLARDGSRYFLAAAEPRVVSAERVDRTAVIAAAAPAEAVEQLHREARRIGWRIGTVVPAHGAWVASTRRQPGPRASWCLLAPCGRTHELLIVRNGRLTMTRRLRAEASGATAARVAEAVSGIGPLVVIGSRAHQGELLSDLGNRGIEVLQLSGAVPEGSPEELAARFAGASTFLELGPASARTVAARRVQRLARAMFAAAAALGLAAAGLEWWGTARELDRVIAVRAQHRRQVAEALAVRAGLDGWEARLRLLRGAEMGAVRWSMMLAELADHLPADAHITSMRATADSILLEGEAGQATASFEALGAITGLRGVRALAPIRQETPDSGPSREQFVLGAALRPLVNDVESPR